MGTSLNIVRPIARKEWYMLKIDAFYIPEKLSSLNLSIKEFFSCCTGPPLLKLEDKNKNILTKVKNLCRASKKLKSQTQHCCQIKINSVKFSLNRLPHQNFLLI